MSAAIKVTASNNRFMIGVLAVYIALRLLMIFIPFPMFDSGITLQEKIINFSYPAFFMHFIAEALYWAIFFYIISLLKFVGVKKFILIAFYISLIIQMAFFAIHIYHFFWWDATKLYIFLEPISYASLMFLVVSLFWIKEPLLIIPFRILSFSLLFIFIAQNIYIYFIVPTTIHFGTQSPYEHLLELIGLIFPIILLYIIIKFNQLIAQKENENA